MGNNAEDQLRCSEGDSETAPGLSDDSLSKHPRIVRLRQQVAALPVDQGYRSRLFHSIDLYAAQIVSRPVYAPEEGWDDLEALQQVTLSDAVEREMQRLLQSPPIRPADVTYQGLPEENDHFIVKITKDKVMDRSAFLQAIESLDRPDHELPAEMDEDAKAVILRTWELLKAQGQGASSLVSRQAIKDLVATHTPSLEAQELMAATSAKAETQSAPTSNAAAFDPNAPETEADGLRAGALRVARWQHQNAQFREMSRKKKQDYFRGSTNLLAGGSMNVLCDPDGGTLESMRPTHNVEWKLVLSGYWSNSPHHSGHIAYYLAKIGAQEWVLDGVERNAMLDDVTQEDVDEGRLNDDQLQAMWGMTLENAQEQEFRAIVAACKNVPPDTLPVDLASILYEAVCNAGGKVIEGPDRSDGLLKG